VSTSDLVRLTCHAQDENTRIDVLDGDLNLVPGSSRLGDTSIEVAPGAYAVRFQIGNDYVERVAILTPGAGEVHVSLDDENAPLFASAAPVRKTRTTREIHRDPARDVSLSAPLPKGIKQGEETGASHLMVFARDLLEGRSSVVARGLTLHDMHGELVANFEVDGVHNLADRWSGTHLAVPSGTYRLRMTHETRRFSEQMVYVVKGWQTQVFLASAGSESDRPLQLENASVLMARPSVGFEPARPDLRRTESALRALRDKGNIPGSTRTEMLWDKFENPMLGLYAGLLHLRRRELDEGLMREVFNNLRSLVGTLPDVLALGWGLALRSAAVRDDALFMQGLIRPGDLSTPPMLRASWELLVQASVEHPDLVPSGSFAERASQTLTTGGPWFSWRGEPPAARRPATPVEDRRSALEDALENLLPIPRFLTKPLAAGLTGVGLEVALPLLAKVLAQLPEAGILIGSRRFTDVERRIAQYVDPLVDPQLRALVEGDDAMKSELREGLASRGMSGLDLVRALQIPSGVALAAIWSLARKLVVQPVLPHKYMLGLFAREESHGQAILQQLIKQEGGCLSTLRHRRGGDPAPDLALVVLRYRGSPAVSLQGAAEPIERTIEALGSAGYVMGDGEGRLATSSDLDAAVDRVRARLIAKLEQELSSGQLRLGEGWKELVLPAAANARKGQLMPEPLVDSGTSPA
jgi:hypothetical protein